MNAKERFDDVMSRCNQLLDLYETSQNSDLLRSAVVFGVAALDAYALDRFMEEFVPFIKSHNLNGDRVKFLADTGVTLEFALGLIKDDRDRPFRLIRTVVEGASGKSMQSFQKINELYKFYGLKGICDNAIDATKKKRIRDNIVKMIARRHAIVHAADYNGKNKLQGLDKRTVSRWLESMKLFVYNFDKIVTNKFKKQQV